MIARCARCQGTFTTDRFGLQTCPHCGSELLLSDPSGAPAPGAPPPPPAAPPAEPPPAAVTGAPPPPSGSGAIPSAPPSGGQGPAGWPPPPPGGWSPPPPAPPPSELPAPFAERRRRGFLAAFFETWKLVALQPQEFFRRVRIDQSGSALLFAVIASTVGNTVAGAYAYLSAAQTGAALEGVVENVPEEQAAFLRWYVEAQPGLTIAQVVLAPLLTVVAVYVVAAILHLLLMLFRGAHRGFDATLTVVAYAGGLLLLVAVPACGTAIAFFWGLVVLVIGLGEAHRCGPGKAAAATLAPAALVCCCFAAAVGLAFPFLKEIADAASQGTTNL